MNAITGIGLVDLQPWKLVTQKTKSTLQISSSNLSDPPIFLQTQRQQKKSDTIKQSLNPKDTLRPQLDFPRALTFCVKNKGVAACATKKKVTCDVSLMNLEYSCRTFESNYEVSLSLK